MAPKTKQPEVMLAKIDQGNVLKRVQECERDIDAIVDTAPEVVVTDHEDYSVACSHLLQLVTKRKFFEAERDGFMEDVRKMIDRVNGWFTAPLAKAEHAEKMYRNAVAGYAELLDEQARALREKAKNAKESAAIALLERANDTAPPKVTGIALITKTRAVIVDEAKIPEEYFKLVLDMKAVEAALLRGDVPGAVLSTEKSVRVTPPKQMNNEG